MVALGLTDGAELQTAAAAADCRLDPFTPELDGLWLPDHSWLSADP